MYCTNCNLEFNTNSTKCPKCGTKIKVPNNKNSKLAFAFECLMILTNILVFSLQESISTDFEHYETMTGLTGLLYLLSTAFWILGAIFASKTTPKPSLAKAALAIAIGVIVLIAIATIIFIVSIVILMMISQ